MNTNSSLSTPSYRIVTEGRPSIKHHAACGLQQMAKRKRKNLGKQILGRDTTYTVGAAGFWLELIRYRK